MPDDPIKLALRAAALVSARECWRGNVPDADLEWAATHSAPEHEVILAAAIAAFLRALPAEAMAIPISPMHSAIISRHAIIGLAAAVEAAAAGPAVVRQAAAE